MMKHIFWQYVQMFCYVARCLCKYFPPQYLTVFVHMFWPFVKVFVKVLTWFLQVFVHIYLCRCLCIYICAGFCAYIFVQVFVHIYLCRCLCIYIYAGVCAYIFVQVFVHNPHQRMGHMSGRMVASQGNHEISMLNINQRILRCAA